MDQAVAGSQLKPPPSQGMKYSLENAGENDPAQDKDLAPGCDGAVPEGGRGQAGESITSLRRGLEVLRTIELAQAATFTEIRSRTALPNATLNRILNTLLAEGWIRRQPESGRYLLRTDANSSPALAAWHRKLTALAEEPRANLQRQVPWPTDLGVRDGAAMLSLDGPYRRHALSANFWALGSRPSMLRSSLGRCYLAFCPDKEREEILAALAHSRLEADRAGLRPDELRRAVAQIRRQGYATRDATHTSADSPERFGAVAVPVLHNGYAVACLCIVWIPAITDEQQILRAHLGQLLGAARLICDRLAAAGLGG